MAEMTVAVPESKEVTSFTDVVVIRPSAWARKDRIKGLVSKLSLKGFLSVVQPHRLTEYDFAQDKWFPTDAFRDIGNKILVNQPSGLNGTLEIVEPILGTEAVNRLKQRAIKFDLAGAHFLHLNDQKRLLYDADFVEGSLMREDSVRNIVQQLDQLRKEGWRIDPIHHGNFLLGGVTRQDLDFVFSLFLGKDNKPHGLVHPALFNRISLNIQAHQIPEDEVVRGGCNVADLRGGKVLVCANSKQAPVAFDTLTRFAQAEIIEAPLYFVDAGGGPRCSISSLSLR